MYSILQFKSILKYTHSHIPVMWHTHIFNQILSPRHISKFLAQCLPQNKYLINTTLLSFYGISSYANTCNVPLLPFL